MDNCNILLESTADGSTVATVLEIPDCQTTDETKQGAVEKVQQLLQKRLAKAEIIKIPVPVQASTSDYPIVSLPSQPLIPLSLQKWANAQHRGQPIFSRWSRIRDRRCLTMLRWLICYDRVSAW
ncbi:MAG: hypothetical protein PUP92_24060 [Rhizonema sp. PD38]|nr:hypothetical protein [Rhizonema sp. PD38]